MAWLQGEVQNFGMQQTAPSAAGALASSLPHWAETRAPLLRGALMNAGV
ncbi:hypothetical protein [Deinococcus cavernae]|nr:hypothetical protein [Deinococcus cavernae]